MKLGHHISLATIAEKYRNVSTEIDNIALAAGVIDLRGDDDDGGKKGKKTTSPVSKEVEDTHDALGRLSKAADAINSLIVSIAQDLRNVDGASKLLKGLKELKTKVDAQVKTLHGNLSQLSVKNAPPLWTKTVEQIKAGLEEALKGRFTKTSLNYASGKVKGERHDVAYIEFQNLRDISGYAPPRQVAIITCVYDPDDVASTYYATFIPNGEKRLPGEYTLGIDFMHVKNVRGTTQKDGNYKDGVDAVQVAMHTQSIEQVRVRGEELPTDISGKNIAKVSQKGGILKVRFNKGVKSKEDALKEVPGIVRQMAGKLGKNRKISASKPINLDGTWQINFTTMQNSDRTKTGNPIRFTMKE